MSPRLPALLTVLLVLAACGPAPEPRGPEGRADVRLGPSQEMIDRATGDLGKLVDAFVPWYLESHPVRASELGAPDYAHLYPTMDRAGVQQRIDELLGWLGELENIPFDFLQNEPRFHFAVLEYGIRNELLDLEENRTWARDPRLYLSTIARGLETVMDPFTPSEGRMEALQGRLETAPALLVAARENLAAPPRIWTSLAIEDAARLAGFLETGLAERLAEGGAPSELPPGVAEARDALVAAIRSYGEWMRTDLLPRANGDFRLGRYLLERNLLYSEHLSLGTDDLTRLNDRAIAEYQRWIEQVAAEIDSTRTTREVVDSILRVRPGPDRLLDEAREHMVAARDWVARSGVVSLPDSALPVVRRGPSYEQFRFSWLEAAGPLAAEAGPMAFTVAAASPDWSEEEQAEYATYFNTAELTAIAINQTFPGQAVQRAYAREHPSPVLSIFPSRSFEEGWAHYSEQLALDEGFGAADPAVRLTQIRRALQMHARWHAVVALHANGQTVDDVVEQFMGIAYSEELPARQQVLRATWDPLYMASALGRMQLVELRRDYRARKDEQEDGTFDLSEFHKQILELGLPLPLARDILIPTRQERPASPRRRR